MAITIEKINNLLSEKWDDVKAAIKDRWGDQITDTELDSIAHQHDEICHLIGGKCGLNERQARSEFNKVMDQLTINRL